MSLPTFFETATARCWLKGPKTSPPPDPPGQTALDITLHGIRPGMTRAEVESLLGPPPATQDLAGRHSAMYHPVPGEQPSWVIYGPAGRVSAVIGWKLEIDGKLAFRFGDPQARVGATLGPATSWQAGCYRYNFLGGTQLSIVPAINAKVGPMTLGEPGGSPFGP